MLRCALLLLAGMGLALGQSAPGQDADQPSPAPVPASPAASPETAPRDGVVDEIERLLRERENAQAAAAAQLQPSQPRTHRFTNQPLSRVLRILAEQAEVNYIEPNFNSEERISVTLTNLTPLQAFYEIAESRGFQVVADGQKFTLRRSDVESPGFYVTRRYPIRHQPAEFLLQATANFLGIKLAAATDQFPAYPKPSNTTVTPDAFSNGGGSGTGTDQSRPRFQPGIPFDAPLSVGGFNRDNQCAISIERSSNSFIIRATPEQQDAVAAEIARLDRREQQILIKTYVFLNAKPLSAFGRAA